MKRCTSLVLAIIAVSTLCSCATINFSDAEATIPNIASGEGRVFFYRNVAIYGGAMRADIFVDGEKVGRSIIGQVFYCDLDAGNHKISLDTIMYSGANVKDFDLADGQSRYVRTWIGGSGFGGRTNMEFVEPDLALPDLRKLDLVNCEVTNGG